MNDLTNKVAVVTGAASAIGERIVERFLGGDCIVAMLDRDKSELQRVVEKFKTAISVDRLHSFEVDVCNGVRTATYHGGSRIVPKRNRHSCELRRDRPRGAFL